MSNFLANCIPILTSWVKRDQTSKEDRYNITAHRSSPIKLTAFQGKVDEYTQMKQNVSMLLKSHELALVLKCSKAYALRDLWGL